MPGEGDGKIGPGHQTDLDAGQVQNRGATTESQRQKQAGLQHDTERQIQLQLPQAQGVHAVRIHTSQLVHQVCSGEQPGVEVPGQEDQLQKLHPQDTRPGSESGHVDVNICDGDC